MKKILIRFISNQSDLQRRLKTFMINILYAHPHYETRFRNKVNFLISPSVPYTIFKVHYLPIFV